MQDRSAQGPFALGVQRSPFAVHRLAVAVRTSVTLMGQDIGSTITALIDGLIPQTGQIASRTANGERPAYSPASRKPSSWRIRVGWRILRRALASIWRMRSRVTRNCRPTSSRVLL
jgi:hypothetical protein